MSNKDEGEAKRVPTERVGEENVECKPREENPNPSVVTPANPRSLKLAKKAEAKRLAAEKRAGNEALEMSLPKLNALLIELRYAPDVRLNWLEHFKSTGLSEADVLAIVAQKPEEKPIKRGQLKQRLLIARHGIKRWLRGQSLLWRLSYWFGWMFLLITSANKLGWSRGAIISIIAILSSKGRWVLNDMKPKNMQLVGRGYNERKFALQRLLETSQRWYQNPPSKNEIDQYRRDALSLAASYVRDHRARYGSREILANILVCDGEAFVVIARSDGLRPVPQRYSRAECTLVARAIETKTPQLTGDLYADFPTTISGKKYNSILVLPVWFDGQVLGAISIDSQEKFHFHLDFDDLQVHLAPYVQLLAITLTDAQNRTVAR